MRQQFSIPLRFLLPILNLAIAVALLHLGYEQQQSVGAHQEPLPPMIERARYIDYALNIPAWAAQSVTPRIFHVNEAVTYWRTMEIEPDWWYMLYVILMWYYIGLRFDKHRPGDAAIGNEKGMRWAFLRRLCLLLYGIFICFRAFTIPWYLEPWFVAAALGWGVALIAGNLYLLTRRPPPGKSMAARSA